jgi:hypothetical protein
MLDTNKSRQDENPFDLTKASDFSDSQIFNYWVDITGKHGGLLGYLNPKSVMPMLLLGGKGSGKTHLMRYCSAPVQALRYDSDLSEAIRKEGYIGIYVRAEGLNVGRFADKGQGSDVWTSVFSFYFELWLASNLVSILLHRVYHNKQMPFEDREFSSKVRSLFSQEPSDVTCLQSLLTYLENTQRAIDNAVNNCAMTRKLTGFDITFSPGSICFGLPKILSELDPELAQTIFVYLIDEIENLSIDQQKFINSLIRYRRDNSSIKIGTRLYGMKTFETIGSGEPIKQNAEYQRVELDSFLREQDKEYAELAKKLITKRLLEASPQIQAKPDIGSYFESMDSSNYYNSTTEKLTSSKTRKGEKPYFEKLRKHLTEGFKGIKSEEVEEILSLLKADNYPLIEKLNIFQLYKRWGTLEQLVTESRKIQTDCSALINGKACSSAYIESYRHFDSDLLAQLFRDYERKIPYAGLDTLIHLSQGTPRNFLGVLKEIYRRSKFANESPFSGGTISVQAQTEGVMDSASWFWEDAQPDSYGTEVRDAIGRLAVLFRSIRYSDKPSECDLCTFSVDFSTLSDRSRSTLEKAENWSYLIRVRDGSKNKNSQSVDHKYQLSPMLAPKWGLSVHRRGSIEIKHELANSIFDVAESEQYNVLLRNRIASMLAPKFSGSEQPIQPELF